MSKTKNISIDPDSTSFKHPKSLLRQYPKFNRNQLIILALALILFGVVVIFMARAATTILATIEAETMTIPAGGTVVSDSTASASKALSLTKNGATTAQVNLPSASSSIIVRAKGVQCNGAPQMELDVNGSVAPVSSVSPTNWTEYTYSLPLPAGIHSLRIKFINDIDYTHKSNRKSCSRDLFIDKVTFLGINNDSVVVINDGTVGTGVNQFEFVGSWAAGAEASSYGSDEHYTATAGAYYQVRFNGTQAKVFTTLDPKHGIAGVSIDGGPEAMVDSYAATRTYGALVYTSPLLPDAAHIMKVRVTGLQNASASASYIVADKVEISSSTTPPPPSVTIVSPTNGATVSNSIPVEATASSGSSISKVDFYIDGVLKATDTTAPYCMISPTATTCGSWDSKTVANGTHMLTVYGYDAAGTKSPAATSTFTMQNTTASNGIYWGAMMDGNETYEFYYPGQRPGGGTWGDAPWDFETWKRFETNAGKTVSMLHYGQPPPWVNSNFYIDVAKNKVTDRGVIPLISMSTEEVPFTDIINGKYDAQILAWGKNAKTFGKPFMLRFNWEMNGDWWTNNRQAKADPASFVKMWQHFHDVVSRPVAPTDGGPAGAGATNVTWVWCPNTIYSGSTPLSLLYPGHNYVDWTCIDGYNWKGGSQSFTQVFQETYNEVNRLSNNKPIVIGETATSQEATVSKADWITNALKTEIPNNFPNIKALVWFNWRIYHEGYWTSWPIESSATSQAAFSSGIASPYYLPSNPTKYGNFPLLTKVPAP